MNEKVDILMAVFNGELFLKQQLDSIVNQTYKNWLLRIRDDGSTDNSIGIINDYIEKYPEKIILLEDNKNIGSCNNFFALLENSNSEYIMFSDQDDVWHTDKIEKTLNQFIELEKEYGKEIPLLLHTDLEVVDETLNHISNSFWKYQQMDVERVSRLNKILLENIVTGCTVMINRALKEKSLPLPNNVFVHDWWLALVASVFGKIEKMDESTILYRQHNQNVAGAKKSNFLHFYKRLLNLDLVKKGLENAVFQASVFYKTYRNDLSNEQVKMLTAFCNIYQYNWLKRRFILLRFGLLKSKFYRNIGLFIVV